MSGETEERCGARRATIPGRPENRRAAVREAAKNLTLRPGSRWIRAMQNQASSSVREMVDRIGNILRRQAELYQEQQRLLDELSALRAEKDDLLYAARRARLAATE